MRTTVISIWSLLTGVGLLMLGNGLLGTLIGVRLVLGQASEFAIGLVMAGYFVGLALGALSAQRVIAAVGHIRAFSAFASVYSAVCLLHAFWFDPPAWGALRIVQGFCMAGLFMCVESWLNAHASNENRGQVMSIYMIVVYFAQGVGQYLLTRGDPTGFVLFALVSAIASIAVVPVALTRLPAPPVPSGQRLPLRKLYAVSPLGVFGSFASGLILGAFYGMGPAFAPLAGLDLRQTALFMALAILGGLALQWPIGRLSDIVDRRTIILAVAAAVAVVSMLLAVATGRSLSGVMIGAALFGALSFTLYPLSVAHANDFANPGDFVGLSGGLLLAYSFGAIGGPIGASALMKWLGPVGLFAFTAVIGILAAIFTLLRIRYRPPATAEEKTPFMAVPRTTPVAASLDPRGPAVDEDVG